ncbi:MAG: ABC transporter permease, partial [Planctomycetales bacterium]|nr:ABC transporter permease [Planctomycetales bacterium]
MAPGELLRLVWESVAGHRLRSALTTLGIVIGIAAVALLSSLGEGARRGIAEQFSQFGTTLLTVAPGKTRTLGVPGALVGTTRRLTLPDAEALRRLPGVRQMDASVSGVASVEWQERSRDVYVLGVMNEAQEIWRWRPRIGAFVPPGDPDESPAVCVLGAKLARELLGERNPLGEPVRVGAARFRVIGVMEPKGDVLGFDLDDAIFVPVVRAMRLFNQFEIHEIHLDVANYRDMDRVAAEVKRVMRER